jgi:L-fuconolactonase
VPNFGIIDTHLHLWDPRQLSYGWQRGNDLLDRPYLIEDYGVACGHIDIAAMVFIECLVDPGQFEAEVRFAEQEALRDPRLKAIVAQLSLEEGEAALPSLQHLKGTTPLLRGVRRIVEFEPELDFCLRPAFIEGVKLLRSLDLSFEINVNYRHLEHVLRFVDRVGDVSLMLDHCGKPGIREGHLEPWRTRLRSRSWSLERSAEPTFHRRSGRGVRVRALGIRRRLAGVPAGDFNSRLGKPPRSDLCRCTFPRLGAFLP